MKDFYNLREMHYFYGSSIQKEFKKIICISSMHRLGLQPHFLKNNYLNCWACFINYQKDMSSVNGACFINYQNEYKIV
jgi:hypothetical protein